MLPVWIPGRVISGHTFKKKNFNIAKLKLEIRGNHTISFRFLQEVAGRTGLASSFSGNT